MNCQFSTAKALCYAVLMMLILKCIYGVILGLGSAPWLNELVNHWYVLNATLTCLPLAR